MLLRFSGTLFLKSFVFAMALCLCLLAAQVKANTIFKSGLPLALVVGNSEYKGMVGISDNQWKRLNNASRDADALAARFSELGFNVIAKNNLGRVALRQQIALLVDTAQQTQAPAVIFYFSGHGTVVDKKNLLMPVDAGEVSSEVNIESDGVDLRWIAEQMRKVSGLRVIMLDACRDSPQGLKSAARGLARPVEESNDVIVHYAAQAGQTSSDGSVQTGLGFYAQALLGALRPGLSLNAVLTETEKGVIRLSNNRQRRQFYGELGAISSFVFRSDSATAMDVRQSMTASDGSRSPTVLDLRQRQESFTQPLMNPSSDLELEFWNSIRHQKTFGPFLRYLAKYPNGRFKEIAVEKVNGASLTKAEGGCLIFDKRRRTTNDRVLEWKGACNNNLASGKGELVVTNKLTNVVLSYSTEMRDGMFFGPTISKITPPDFENLSPLNWVRIESIYEDDEQEKTHKTITFRGGQVYQGEADGIAPNGQGAMLYPNGAIQHGMWEKGKFVSGNTKQGKEVFATVLNESAFEASCFSNVAPYGSTAASPQSFRVRSNETVRPSLPFGFLSCSYVLEDNRVATVSSHFSLSDQGRYILFLGEQKSGDRVVKIARIRLAGK